MLLRWEPVDEEYINNPQIRENRYETERAEVPGGWLYRVTTWFTDRDYNRLDILGTSIAFVPTQKEG